MWYTLLIFLDIFLWWQITGALLSLIGITHASYVLPWSLVPNVLLFTLYLLFRLPESQTFRSWSGWDTFRAYWFDFKTEGEIPDTQVMYAVVPHGIFGVGAIFSFALNAQMAHVRLISTSLLFWIPIVREFACLGGAIPANSADIIAELETGRSIMLMPEGLRAIFHRDEEDGILTVVETRKGFIRCAKTRPGLKIVPVYIEGTNDLYHMHLIWPWFQNIMLKRYMYPWPIVAFGWLGTFWPRSTPMTMRIGKPIDVDERTIDDIHKDVCTQIGVLKEGKKP